MSQVRRSTRKKRQTQLSFTPLPSSSPATSQYAEQIQQRAASVRYEDPISRSIKRRRLASSNDGSPLKSQKVEVVIPSPSKSADQLPTPAASSQVELDNDRASNQDEKSPSSARFPKDNAARSTLQPVTTARTETADYKTSSHRYFSEEEDDEDDIIPAHSIRRNRPAPVILSSNDGDSPPQRPSKVVTPTKKSRLFQRHSQAGSSPTETGSEAPVSRLRQKISESLNSTRDTSGNSKPQSGSSKAKRARKGAEPILISDGNESTSSEDVVTTPVQRRRTLIRTKPSTRGDDPIEQDEQSDDLQEELEDLQSNGTPLHSTRTGDGPIVSERSKRQQKLEELRRRRAGIREKFQVAEEEDEYDDNDESELSEPEPIYHAMGRGSNLDEYEDDFVDDEDDKMGVDLGVAGVPLEFTYHANKKPFEHFKMEVEWMVHNKLNPAFDRHDEMYQLAHQKLDKEVEGFVGSKFSSTVWGEDFNKALQSRPDLNRIDVPTMLEHKCDACRRTNHPPKHKITFSGSPYDRATLEIVENEDEDDDTEDSDGDKSSSSQEGKTFFLGRYCCANAEMAHALHHWRYSLNQTVLAWLVAEGYLTPAKIIERESLRRKKRQDATNKIVDGMEDTGVMKWLYQQFKDNLAIARDAKAAREVVERALISKAEIQLYLQCSRGQ